MRLKEIAPQWPPSAVAGTSSGGLPPDTGALTLVRALARPGGLEFLVDWRSRGFITSTPIPSEVAARIAEGLTQSYKGRPLREAGEFEIPEA